MPMRTAFDGHKRKWASGNQKMLLAGIKKAIDSFLGGEKNEPF